MTKPCHGPCSELLRRPKKSMAFQQVGVGLRGDLHAGMVALEERPKSPIDLRGLIQLASCLLAQAITNLLTRFARPGLLVPKKVGVGLDSCEGANNLNSFSDT